MSSLCFVQYGGAMNLTSLSSAPVLDTAGSRALAQVASSKVLDASFSLVSAIDLHSGSGMSGVDIWLEDVVDTVGGRVRDAVAALDELSKRADNPSATRPELALRDARIALSLLDDAARAGETDGWAFLQQAVTQLDTVRGRLDQEYLT